MARNGATDSHEGRFKKFLRKMEKTASTSRGALKRQEWPKIERAHAGERARLSSERCE